MAATAMAITQIHTHRRNRHGSWRDGEGGALDAPRPLDPGLDGGADAVAPTERSKSVYKPTRSHPTVGLRTASLEDGSLSTPALAVGRNAFALALLVDSARHASLLACRKDTHILASHSRHMAKRSRRSRRSLSLSQLTAQQARRGPSTGASRARAEQALTY